MSNTPWRSLLANPFILMPTHLRSIPWIGVLLKDNRLALLCLVSVLFMLATWQGIWHYPILKDSSVHIYIGQHLLRGGIPYQTAFYFHPPGRFLVSTVWAFVSRLGGTDPVLTARAFDLGVAACILVLVYHIGAHFSRDTSGGLFACLFLLTVEFGYLDALAFRSPNLKITATFAILLSIYMVQQSRWLWAGVMAATGAMIWLPLGLVGLCLAIVSLVKDKSGWLNGVSAVVLGTACVLVVVVIYLAAAGSLFTAWQQTVGSLIPRAPADTIAATTSALIERPIRSLSRMWLAFQGERVLVILVVVSISGLLRRPKPADNVQLAIWLATGVLTAFLLVDFQGEHDFMLLEGLLAIIAGSGANRIIQWIGAAMEQQNWPSLPLMPIAFTVLALYRFSDVPGKLARWDYSLTLADQRTMAHAAAGQLSEWDGIQSFSTLWLNIWIDRDNSVPVLQLGPKATPSFQVGGYTFDKMIMELEAERPVLLIVEARPQFLADSPLSGWLATHYVYMGHNPLSATERVYIRRDRADLMALVEGWPLENN